MALVYSHPDDDDAAEGYHEQLPLVSNAASSFQRLDTDEENEVDPQPKSLRKSFHSAQGFYPSHLIEYFCTRLKKLSRGPDRPHIQKITTAFAPSLQVQCLHEDRFRFRSKKYHHVSLVALLLLWAFVLFFSVWSSLKPLFIPVYGSVKPIRCMQQAWYANDYCGLNGINCEPFSNVTIAYQCPPDCASKEVFEPHVIGDQEVTYSTLVIGGAHDVGTDAIYRADSSICQAAIHAGVIENSKGGIFLLRLTGAHANFPAAFANGIQSIGFDSTFPKSFVFMPYDGGNSNAVDIRWPMLLVSVLTTLVVSIFSISPSVYFTAVCTILFTHVALISDRPELPTLTALVSTLAGRYLPAAFVAAVVYRFCVEPQLSGLNAPFERTILWLGGAWFGALENYTMDHLPIRRLTPHDLQTQPGAVLTLLAIIIVIVAIALGQIYYLRLECRLRCYLKVYACMISGLAILAAIPSLHLRIHHYILALLLLPGTAIQTRPSLLYQGFLIGLFINGIARWGFDSILQTENALRSGDGRYGSPLPSINTSIAQAASVKLQWAVPPSPYDGISMLVNDIERYRWYTGQEGSNFTWNRGADSVDKFYFRFAYRTEGHAVDYTKAGVWEVDGRWTSFEHD